MESCSLLLANNSAQYKVKSKNNSYFRKYEGLIDLKKFGNILDYICSINKRHSLRLAPITIQLENVIIDDKLIYILLECLCYDLLINKDCNFTLLINCNLSIINEGLQYSCLDYSDPKRKDLFKKRFAQDIQLKHFRRIVYADENFGENLSALMDDIDMFLQHISLSKEACSNICETVVELVDNAYEHARSACLIDIDVTKDYRKTDPNDKNLYFGVNIAIINFSDILFGERLKEKVKKNDEKLKGQKRFADVLRARANHEKHFGEIYDEDFFFMISSFQDQISSRDRETTGGKGLTGLISEIQNYAETDKCFMVSGEKMIKLLKRFMVFNKDNWIGFNEQNDYINSIPSENCICKNGFNMRGTAFQLTFVIKKEDVL